MIEQLYKLYLKQINKAKQDLLDQYQIDLLIKRHPAVKISWYKKILLQSKIVLKLKELIVGKRNNFIIDIDL